MSLEECWSQEAAKRDLNWYEFGKNMEWVHRLLKEAGEGAAVDCAREKYKKLEARLKCGKEVDILSAIRDFDILFMAVLRLPTGGN